ncbi:Mrp/NBP35 family ATP-binding protein [Roseiarcaceae bacterium H3SJ34-1]|uniref:Mrp/NBP35 family ATP-binding protein n=1 Tax=Terripilifer ovatus TaxID=3032367 RepID=UPI003AB99A4D|nr:Mrp/NBP35 family ATP-binding protein [Roseiarcaceae bacterium H3SJ34-1]
MAVAEIEIKRALEKVALPDGTPLAASGRLTNIVVKDGKVIFAIAINAAEANAFETVRQAAERAVRALPGVSQVLVGLTAEKPAGAAARAPAQPSGQETRLHDAKPSPASAKSAGIPGVKHIVAVASGKGGVGKSTTACNLALGLVALGLKVGMLDADIYGPSQPKLFGITGKPAIDAQRKMVPHERYGVKVMSIGFLVDETQAMIWRGPMVMSALGQMLRDVAWGELDVLVVDMPPGTGDAQLTLAQQTPLAGAVIVSTPQDLALLDARRGVAMFNKVSVPVLGVVENMSTFCCPNCGHVSPIFGHGGARHEAEKLGVPFLGEIPLDMEIRETSDEGCPVMATNPSGAHAQAYLAIAQRVADALKTGSVSRPAPRIVIE